MPRVQPLLHSLRGAFEQALGDGLTGLYVHGSLAFGCFSWERSDVDLIAVANRPLTQTQKLGLLDALARLLPESPPKGLEMSVVLETACKPFFYPTPYELHFSNDWLSRYRADPLALCDTAGKTDIDLAAHFTVLRAVGYALCGAAVEDVFAPVPPACYWDSITADVADARTAIWENYPYTVLNLCRVLAYARTGRVLSKQSGGEWALDALAPRWHIVVRSALSAYTHGQPVCIDEKESAAFCEQLLSQIAAVKM